MASKVAPDVTETNGAAVGIPQENLGLRRAVGVWGSYTWGYADVGADVYVALGIVMAAAQGATNVAFLFAGLAVLLDFTIDIALFALASAGYLNFFFPVLSQHVDLNLLGLSLPGVQP